MQNVKLLSLFFLGLTLSLSACSKKLEKQSIYIDQSLKGSVKTIVTTASGQEDGQASSSRTVSDYSIDKELLRTENRYKYGENESVYIQELKHEYDARLYLESVKIKTEEFGDKTEGVISFTYPEEGVVISKEISRNENNNYHFVKLTKHFVKNGLEVASERSEGFLGSGIESTTDVLYEYDDSKNIILEQIERASMFTSRNEIQTFAIRFEYLDFDQQGNWIKSKVVTTDSEGKEVQEIETREIEYY